MAGTRELATSLILFDLKFVHRDLAARIALIAGERDSTHDIRHVQAHEFGNYGDLLDVFASARIAALASRTSIGHLFDCRLFP